MVFFTKGVFHSLEDSLFLLSHTHYVDDCNAASEVSLSTVESTFKPMETSYWFINCEISRWLERETKHSL